MSVLLQGAFRANKFYSISALTIEIICLFVMHESFFHLKKSNHVNCHPLWPIEHAFVSQSPIGQLHTDFHR